MDKQEGLFDQARARSTDPVHSHEAAASVVNLGRTREAILALLRNMYPMTDERLADQYMKAQWAYGEQAYPRVSASGLRSRRSELVKMGFVEAAGTGKTASGRACTIWRIKK